MKIACLHTMESNAALFDAACPEGATLVHAVREDLIARAVATGGASEALLEEAAEALRALMRESGADALLLTCTSIGGAAARAGAIRVDEALAAAAAAEAGTGGLIDVLISLPSTEGPTREMFERHAAAAGARIRIVLVEGALAAFQAKDLERYAALVAAAADRSEAPVVALAQASMAPAAARARRAVMTSPAAALAAASRR
ncbi:MAG: hypothetical protein ACE37J_17835 [Pikeienuella sp.]|uniref:hypothetical protein n=1 Tax=Pikeienuella sp. TaxID=2831957 RepID=UPI00391CA261